MNITKTPPVCWWMCLHTVLFRHVSPWQQCAGFHSKQYTQEAIQLNQRLLWWAGIKTGAWSSIKLHWKPLFYTSSHILENRKKVQLVKAVSHFRGRLQRCVLNKAASAVPILGLTETIINSAFRQSSSTQKSENFRVELLVYIRVIGRTIFWLYKQKKTGQWKAFLEY